MTRGKLRGTIALLALGAAVVVMKPAPTRAQGPEIEPEAKQILKRMTDYLGGLESFSLETDNMLEDVLVSGQKIQYDFTANVQIQRPNRVRVERTGDELQQLFVYDGATLAMYNPDDGYFAKTAAPDNIDDLLHFARDTLDIVPPTGDMVFTNAFDLLMAGVTEGFVVGKSVVGGVSCDHLAFRTPVVDWQIWIADGDQPLPHKYVLTTMDDPAHPQYLVLMSNWNVAPEFDDAMFQLAKPEGAKEIEFLRMDVGQSVMD
ncbi:MAG: DUF2092 domain-containing protein [Thermoanaerobaculia bacterium]